MNIVSRCDLQVRAVKAGEEVEKKEREKKKKKG